MDKMQRLVREMRAKQARVDELRRMADELENEVQRDWAHIQREAHAIVQAFEGGHDKAGNDE